MWAVPSNTTSSSPPPLPRLCVNISVSSSSFRDVSLWLTTTQQASRQVCRIHPDAVSKSESCCLVFALIIHSWFAVPSPARQRRRGGKVRVAGSLVGHTKHIWWRWTLRQPGRWLMFAFLFEAHQPQELRCCVCTLPYVLYLYPWRLTFRCTSYKGILQNYEKCTIYPIIPLIKTKSFSEMGDTAINIYHNVLALTTISVFSWFICS